MRDGGVVALEDVAGGVRGGGDDCGDRAEAERHERAVARREAREGAVRVGAEVQKAADERQRAGARRQVAAAVGDEAQEVGEFISDASVGGYGQW
ncbi:hypothetical protein C2845_PM13G24190 [Panicum miliaceum]|uniref:Uncharacterized protein n=1 Tax=Panicum miliaceum TaxID=4540 RepID=A0A3L6RJN3_PANMI|nr:hypothetical protein C2845_PM13G24190 [Panicum miliaceum]